MDMVCGARRLFDLNLAIQLECVGPWIARYTGLSYGEIARRTMTYVAAEAGWLAPLRIAQLRRRIGDEALHWWLTAVESPTFRRRFRRLLVSWWKADIQAARADPVLGPVITGLLEGFERTIKFLLQGKVVHQRRLGQAPEPVGPGEPLPDLVARLEDPTYRQAFLDFFGLELEERDAERLSGIVYLGTLDPLPEEFSLPRRDSEVFWRTVGVDKDDPRALGVLMDLLMTGLLREPERWRRLVSFFICRALWYEKRRESEPADVGYLDPDRFGVAVPMHGYEERDLSDIIPEVDQLPSKEQRALKLNLEAKYTDSSLKEVCADAGENYQAVRQNYSRACRRLRQMRRN